MRLSLDLIRMDGDTQSRTHIDLEVVKDYADAMREGVEFPAVTIFHDDETYWLADGFHRVYAALEAGLVDIHADVRQGTRRDAVLHSVGANAAHGLRRTNADKRRAVETLLRDEVWGEWSDREIARRCGVSAPTVGKWRAELSVKTLQINRKAQRNGATYTMNTNGIGKKEAEALPALPDHTPEEVRDRVDTGELPRKQAIALADALVEAPAAVRAVALEHGVPEADLISRLTHAYRNKLATWDTIRDTGTLDGERPIGKVSPTEFDGYLDRLHYEHRKAAIEERRRKLIEEAKQATLRPDAKYRVIYADPPWSYGNSMPDYFTEQSDHYPTMEIDEICALPVKAMSEDNAVLFLWATSPNLPQGLQVIEAWGFRYVASFVWDKVQHNMGHYNSVRHELLLIGVRGSCQPDERKLFDSVVSVERTEHSRKPDEFRQIINTLYPHGKRIELFARQRVPGWEGFGNELEAAAD